MLYLYKGNMNKDCCAANFERAVFMYEPVVNMLKGYHCVKSTDYSESIIKRFALNKKKPAILLLDAEGGLIHKTQICSDPRKYLRVVKRATALNAKRMKLRAGFIALHKELKAKIGKENYSDAVKAIEKAMKRREFMTGHVLSLLEAEKARVHTIGQELLEKAEDLRENKKLLAAYDLYKEIEKEFAKIDELSDHAKKCRREVRKELKELGVGLK